MRVDLKLDKETRDEIVTMLIDIGFLSYPQRGDPLATGKAIGRLLDELAKMGALPPREFIIAMRKKYKHGE